VTVPAPSFDHILAMSNHVGMYEHAKRAAPRVSHGYCTDDMSRLLIVLLREPHLTPELLDLGRVAFRFIAGAQGVAGHVRNRRTSQGRWLGRRGVDDCWGRSLWAFGVAARMAPEAWMREHARSLFTRGIEQRSPWRRSMAFAALGAAEVLAADPAHAGARRLLADAVEVTGRRSVDPVESDWLWPEARLAYANAVIPETLIVGGHLLNSPRALDAGIGMLRWLLDRETVDGHLSPTPVGGSDRDDMPPGFDQQPIEVAAMADACARAYSVTGDTSWRVGVELAVRWFAGDNDSGELMWDAETGGGFDGLHATGHNVNEGAESTLALIATLQHARQFGLVAA
jgi:hypothetical protein